MEVFLDSIDKEFPAIVFAIYKTFTLNTWSHIVHNSIHIFICGFSTMGIMIHSTYGMNDLKTDLQGYFMKCGVKDEGICFLFTEG
jgi:hypothetical protein